MHLIYQTTNLFNRLFSLVFTLVPKRLYHLLGATPPGGLLILAILSIQLGASLAVHIFPMIGPTGTVFLRITLSAVILLIAWRPAFDDKVKKHIGLICLFGFTIAAMNVLFYEAIALIPLGTAVTIEFVGPLGLAVVTSRRGRDFFWIFLAVIGIVLLAPFRESHIDKLGILYASIAGVGWAAYILLSKRLGQIFSGGVGLTLGMTAAAIILLPLGIVKMGNAVLNPMILIIGLGIALLSTTIPFTLEFEALKRLSPHKYGILISTEPAIAVIIGIFLLDEHMDLRKFIAVTLVTIAAVGISYFEKKNDKN